SKRIHLDIDPACINKNIPADVPLVGPVKDILPRLAAAVRRPDTAAWRGYLAEVRQAHPLRYAASEDVIMPQWLIQQISKATKGEAIVTADVGQHQMWTAQYYQFNRSRSW